MSNENVYYITIPTLRNNTTSTFYGKENTYREKNWTSTYFDGDMYFDSELVKNKKKKASYSDGLLVGRVNFTLTDAHKDADARIQIFESHVINEDMMQLVELTIACTNDVFDGLNKASANKNEIRIRFNKSEWEDDSDGSGYVSKCKIAEIQILPPNTTVASWFAERRIRHVENYLFTTLCGGDMDGQIPTICSEFAQSFANQSLFNKRKETIESITELISSVKWTLEIEKSKLRIEIEEDDDLELAKLFSLRGVEFDTQLEKITDAKKQSDIVLEYNTFWKSAEAVKMFNDGFNWCGDEFPMLAEEYLKIESINSPYLNEVLIDGLISKDIAATASHFQYNDKMSSEAILSVRNGVYNKSDLETKNKSFKEVIIMSGFKSLGWLIGNLVSGLFIWWITAFIASDNEMAHYILFGTIFAASLIVTALNQSKTTEAIQENKEEFNFYILRDMCALHKQAEYMDAKLLRHLMYKLEERGVQFNQHIYKLIDKNSKFI